MGRIERLVVTNHERWGNLVKTWATGSSGSVERAGWV